MDELLMCSVCIERYHEKERHPVLLPRCGHSFCRPCIKMLLTGGCIVCPTCRSDQRIEAADRLPTEYTLLAIIRAQEESRKEICERHCVKLSFWCRTCSIATCGECLFEDHPTHSHDVTKATKYIGEMKQNAYDVAVKFMEVLDDREQTFYKTIFSSAKKISNALRNVGALRKDMEEARELMKGIKEDDSLSAATALSEAAKFLGLKWNIQDANIYQNPQDSREEDSGSASMDAKTDKERIMEEEIEAEQERNKKKQQDKEAKRALRRSRTMSSVEMSKANEVMDGEKDVLKKLESIAEVSLQEDLKMGLEEIKKQLSGGKDVTLNKEVEQPSTKPKKEPKKEQVALDPVQFKEELTKLKGGLKRTEDPLDKHLGSASIPTSPTPTDSTKPKAGPRTDKATASQQKYLERIQAKAEAEAKAEADAKAKAEADAKTEAEAEVKAEAEAKAALEAQQKTTQHGAKTPVEGIKSPAELIKTPIEETKSPQESRDSSPTPSASSSMKDEVQEEVEITQEIEKLEEELIELSEEDQGRTQDENSTPLPEESNLNPDSGLSEDSKAASVAVVKKEDKYELKLQECIQVPGFMVAVEADDGRLGGLEWGPQGLHVHCLQFHGVTYDIVIKSNILNTMIPSMHPIAFLELGTEGNTLGRVYIRLWGHLRRAHNFLTLCIGDRGKSYLNTKFLQVYNVNTAGERMLGGDYESNNGRGGGGIIDDLEWNSDYAMPMKAGMITAAGTGQNSTNSLFLLCSQSDPERNFSCPFGLVCEGLKVIKEAVQQAVTKDVYITDCGALLVPPRSDVAKYFS